MQYSFAVAARDWIEKRLKNTTALNLLLLKMIYFYFQLSGDTPPKLKESCNLHQHIYNKDYQPVDDCGANFGRSNNYYVMTVNFKNNYYVFQYLKFTTMDEKILYPDHRTHWLCQIPAYLLMKRFSRRDEIMQCSGCGIVMQLKKINQINTVESR